MVNLFLLKVLIRFRYPWNWKNPIGYAMAVLMKNTGFLNGGVLIINFLLLFVGFCNLFRVLAVDIKDCLNKFSDIVVRSQGKLTVTNRLEITRKLAETMQFHADAKK